MLVLTHPKPPSLKPYTVPETLSPGVYGIFMWVVVKIMIPFGVPINTRCRSIIGIQKGTIILTTTRMIVWVLYGLRF